MATIQIKNDFFSRFHEGIMGVKLYFATDEWLNYLKLISDYTMFRD